MGVVGAIAQGFTKLGGAKAVTELGEKAIGHASRLGFNAETMRTALAKVTPWAERFEARAAGAAVKEAETVAATTARAEAAAGTEAAAGAKTPPAPPAATPQHPMANAPKISQDHAARIHGSVMGMSDIAAQTVQSKGLRGEISDDAMKGLLEDIKKSDAYKGHLAATAGKTDGLIKGMVKDAVKGGLFAAAAGGIGLALGAAVKLPFMLVGKGDSVHAKDWGSKAAKWAGIAFTAVTIFAGGKRFLEGGKSEQVLETTLKNQIRAQARFAKITAEKEAETALAAAGKKVEQAAAAGVEQTVAGAAPATAAAPTPAQAPAPAPVAANFGGGSISVKPTVSNAADFQQSAKNIAAGPDLSFNKFMATAQGDAGKGITGGEAMTFAQFDESLKGQSEKRIKEMAQVRGTKETTVAG